MWLCIISKKEFLSVVCIVCNNYVAFFFKEPDTPVAPVSASPHLLLGSAFGMKVPPPEYSGIPQDTAEIEPEHSQGSLLVYFQRKYLISLFIIPFLKGY